MNQSLQRKRDYSMYEKNYFEPIFKRIKGERSICRWLKKVLTSREHEKEIIDRARQEYDGFHVLPGTMNRPYFVGNPPQWYENPVDDEEYVWVLNRMGHWKDFVIAYALTDEKRYAQKILDEMMDWIEKCPCPDIKGNEGEIRNRFAVATPWRSLEGGIRMFDSWPVAVRFLIQENYMDFDQFAQAASCVISHARMLMTVPPVLWPKADHNHYLMENLGLFYAAGLLRGIPEADGWRKHASQELIRCVENQLTEEGGQIEGSPSYHNQTVVFFCKWIMASDELDPKIPEKCLARVRKALDYSIYTVRPTGTGVPFGDSDPEYSAVLAAMMGLQTFGSRRWISVLTQLAGRKKVLEIYDQNPFELYKVDRHTLEENFLCDDFQTISWQKHLGQAMMRTDWGKDALSIFFACKIPCQNGHSHIDPASFDFSAYGKALAVDPGRYTYREDENRRLFKSATMHNTLMLDGQEPFQYVTRWSFSGEHDGCICHVERGERYMMAIAVHTSYFPTIHERLIAIVDRKFLIVWDRLDHKEEKNVDIWYHLDSTKVELSDGMVYTTDKPGIALHGSTGLSVKLKKGKISDKMDVYRESTRVCFSDKESEKGRDNYLCILYPFSDRVPELSEIQLQNKGRTAITSINKQRYTFEWDGNIFSVR